MHQKKLRLLLGKNTCKTVESSMLIIGKTISAAGLFRFVPDTESVSEY